MRKYLATLLLTFSLVSCAELGNLGSAIPTSITDAEAAQGIREALDQGVGRGIGFLNKTDGFFGNEAYKLFLPAEVQRIENTLRQLGMGSMVDRAILQINRAAEDAVAQGGVLVVDADGEPVRQAEHRRGGANAWMTDAGRCSMSSRSRSSASVGFCPGVWNGAMKTPNRSLLTVPPRHLCGVSSR